MAVDVTYYRTPAWLVALILVAGLGAGTFFVLFLLTHAHYRTVEEQRAELKRGMPELERQKIASETAAKVSVERTEERRKRLADLNEVEKQYIDDVARMGNEFQKANGETDEAYKKRVERYLDLMKQAPATRKELDTEETRQYAQEKEYDDRRQQLRAQIETLQQEVEAARKKARAENKEKDDRVAELEERVRQITRQLDPGNRSLKSDGQLIASAASDGYVVIDRGHQQNLRNGTTFQVWTRRAGRVVRKGVIQVINVEQELSTCRVIAELDPNDPLLPGDQLHNPVYDPDKKITFTIRGEFKRFSSEEMARLITDAGASVDGQLTTGTDYLVAGTNCQKDLELATKLGMTVLSEDQLLDFVRARPRWRSQAVMDYLARESKSGKTIAVVGTFTKADAAVVRDWIRKNGGGTSGSVSAGVAVVIAGDNALDDMAKARELAIPVVDQAQFSHLSADDLKP
jgi:NAD-dependent DNA ligase